MPWLSRDQDPEREAGGRGLWQHATTVIDQLPHKQRAVLILRGIEGRSAADACALLTVSAANQHVLLHRARGRVRCRIDALTASDPDATRGAGFIPVQ